MRVVGVRARMVPPRVIAIVDGRHRVMWDLRGWDCTCRDDDCRHVEVVAALLDPRVTGDEDLVDVDPVREIEGEETR